MKKFIETHKYALKLVGYLISMAFGFGAAYEMSASKVYVDAKVQEERARVDKRFDEFKDDTNARLERIEKKSDRTIELLLDHAQKDRK